MGAPRGTKDHHLQGSINWTDYDIMWIRKSFTCPQIPSILQFLTHHEGPSSDSSWPLWELCRRRDLFEAQETTLCPVILLIMLSSLKHSGGSRPLSCIDTWWEMAVAAPTESKEKGRNDNLVSSQAVAAFCERTGWPRILWKANKLLQQTH